MEIMEQIRLMTLDMQRWKEEKYGRQQLTEQQFLDRYKTCDKCARQAVCTELARVLRTSKEEVYKQAIRSIGAATPTQILEAAVERYIQIWTGQGLGWVVENQGRCKDRPGYVMLACYHGSSVYNTKEMACLIDYLIEAAKDQGIDVMSEADKSLLLKEWGHEKK